MIDGYCIRAIDQNLAVTGDGRTVTGLLAPYGEVARVDDGFGPYWETFDPGCFDRCVRHGNASYLRVQLEHNGHWVGRGQVFRDDPSKGLAADLRLDDTEAGREAAFKIRDGQTPGLSLAFLPGNGPHNTETVHHKRDNREVVHRKRVKALHHVALCQFPAYATAQVAAVREAPIGAPARLAYWQDWTKRVKRD
jgi:HK97 family phage prohead protease